MTARTLIILLALTAMAFPALASDKPAPAPIRIGEISEAKLWNIMAVNQRRGFELALHDINKAGGVLGRTLELVSRDGGAGTPEDVLRDAEDLVSREGVKLLIGTGMDNVGLAVSNFARQRGIFYLKGINGSSRHIWEKGHDLAFRFDVPNYMYGAVFAKAAAELPARRWAVAGPDYEFGRSIIGDFKKALKERRPDVEFVAEQWHPTLKIEAQAVARAIKNANPDGIFLANFGSDIVQLMREGRKIDLFKDRAVFSVLLGQPEQLEPLGAEAPEGWVVQGYPYDSIDTPAHKKFVADYKARFGAAPGWFSFVGYNSLMSLARAIGKAGSDDPAKVAAAMKGMIFDSLVGPITYRAADNQSDLGVWVGKIGFDANKKPVLTDWTLEKSDDFYPGDAFVKTVRGTAQ